MPEDTMSPFELVKHLLRFHGDHQREVKKIKAQIKKYFTDAFMFCVNLPELEKEKLCDKIEEEIFLCEECDTDKAQYCDDHIALYKIIENISFSEEVAK